MRKSTKEDSSTQKIHISNKTKLTENIAIEQLTTTNQEKKKKNKKNKNILFKNNYNTSIKVESIIVIKINEFELNRLEYDQALKFDKRTFFEYFWSILKIGDLFLFSFITTNDYNLKLMKICLFFFSFSLYYTVDALFYTESTIDNIYEKKGEYDFIYQIPKILYSNLICTFINIIIKTLSLSEKSILKIKSLKKDNNYENQVAIIRKAILTKFILFYVISFIFLIFFWFYVSVFCAVYRNTQLYLIKDTVISFGLSLIYPFCYYLIPGLFRIPALRSKSKSKECLYKLSVLAQSL